MYFSNLGVKGLTFFLLLFVFFRRTFLDGPLACDCGLERFLRSSPVKVFGTCSEDREVHELNSEDIRCDSDHTPGQHKSRL